MHDIGLVVGKFYPPHAGHHFLIDTARANCKRLTVAVVDTAGENPPGPLRQKWIQETHPDLNVVLVRGEPEFDNDSEWWAHKAGSLCGHTGYGQPVRYPNVVFTSEDYGNTWAGAITRLARQYCHHHLVDRSRHLNPISGTAVRENPFLYWSQLEPCVREFYTKRVLFIGGESTGKSTLTRNMAELYSTPYTTEAGRDFVEKYGPENRDAIWSYIVREQQRRESEAARASDGLIFCDTDLVTTLVWYDAWVGVHSPVRDMIYNAAIQQVYEYAILLNSEDVPHIQDGTRTEDKRRAWFTQQLYDQYRSIHLRTPHIVGGSFEERELYVQDLVREWIDGGMK